MADTNILLDVAARQERLEAEIIAQRILEYPSGTSGTVTYDIPEGKEVVVLSNTTLTVWADTIGGAGTLTNNGTILYITSES